MSKCKQKCKHILRESNCPECHYIRWDCALIMEMHSTFWLLSSAVFAARTQGSGCITATVPAAMKQRQADITL